MKTDEEIQQHCTEFGLGRWEWGVCQGKDCTGCGVLEDTFDGLCRWCSCEEKRPVNPADYPPLMRAEADEWSAWLERRFSRKHGHHFIN